MLRLRSFALLLVPVALLLLAACMPSDRIGPRPAAGTLGSVEAYLQRYQPGPLPRVFQTTRYLDRHGRLLAEQWEEGRRTWIPLSRVSKHLIDATIATEDATFYQNLGVDPARIAGAALKNAQEGQVVSGASTITMQLARNLFLGPEDRYDQDMDRKMIEAGLAQELTSLFTKDELLEMYLNLLNYSHLAYGPEAAAQVYFGKKAADLTLAEATLLAGIPQRPADLDPFKDFQAAKDRQRVVLDLMVRHGYLTLVQADATFAEEISLNPTPDLRVNSAPHFVQVVQQQIDAQLGDGATPRAGLQITTTLDLEMQNLAQATVTTKVAEARPRFDLTNGALVALRPGANEVLAMVGSADFNDAGISGQVNVATSPRQPGSAIKPVFYATALNDNLASPATVLWDIPVTYTLGSGLSYTPRNYDGKFHGPLTVRTALANSYNIPAVKLLDAVGIERMAASAKTMGLASLPADANRCGLSLTLGGCEVTLFDLTTAFATLANGGKYTGSQVILEARDALGQPIPVVTPAPPVQAVSAAAAFQITDILSDNAARTPAFGPESVLRLSRPAAAKTGTTTDFRDNWTVGFTRYLVSGVWAGNSDGHPMKNTSGLTGAAPIWHDFMEAVLTRPEFLQTLGAPASPAEWQFKAPDDVEQRADCPPGVTCREGGEWFAKPWLAAAGDAGPLADSVSAVATAPVYVDRGQGGQWAAYCQVEPAAERSLLRLPGKLGLPDKTAAGEDAASAPPASQEQLQAVGWALLHPTPVNLGPCDNLGALAPNALALGGEPNPGGVQVAVDMAAAMDPNAGPVAGAAAVVVSGSSAPPGSGRYRLAQPVNHDHSCPGNYIMGQVQNGNGAPVAGVRIALADQWGNNALAVSKDGPSDFGLFDFPINYFANRYTLTVVDDAGHPLSEAVVVDHLQGASGDAPCHWLLWTEG